MLKVALRGLLAHKGRLLATFLAVALGVAFIGGVLVLTDTMNTSFDDLFADVYKGTDAVVRSSETIDSGFEGEVRGDVDEGLLDTVRGVSTVTDAEGDVQGYVQMIGSDGEAVGASGFGPPTFGGNWPDVEALNPWRLRDGVAPDAAGQVVVDAGTASAQGYKVGDTVTVQTEQGVGSNTLVGIAGFGTADSPAGASYVLYTTEEAQDLVGQAAKFSAISVVAADGVSQDEVVRDLQAVVGDGIQVISGEEITEESQSDLKSQLSFLTIALVAFAVIAVVVGAFVIYNSFSIVVAQRTREMALLRAVGASRRQVRRSVLLEAVAVGLLGSVAGFVLGLGIASLLVVVMQIEGSLVIAPTAVVVSLLVGVVVTAVSALLPARQASRVPPVAAMREVAIDTSGRSLVRFGVGLALIVLGCAGTVVGVAQSDMTLVGLGIFAAFAGVIVAGPGLAQPVSEVVGWPLSRFRGVTGSLARENAGRNPKRSAVTAYALMIGVGITSFFLIVNASLRASIDKVLDETFTADFIIQAGLSGQLGLPEGVADSVRALSDVQTVVEVRQAPARVDNDSTVVVGTSPDAFNLFGLDVEEGSDALGAGQVVVLDDAADKDGLSVGSTIDATFLNSGTAQLAVAGIYTTSTESSSLGDYVVGIDELASLVPDSSDSMVLVKLADGVSVSQAQPIVEDAVKPYGTAEVHTLDDYKKVIGSSLDLILNMILGLLAFAFVIAALGIANTIALSVLERTRELGLLRAVGMSQRQVRSAIRWESVIIALFGTALGLLVGGLGGWGVVSALRDEGFDVFRVPVATLLVLALVAGILGLLAALVPAWRAGRLKVLDAIRTD